MFSRRNVSKMNNNDITWPDGTEIKLGSAENSERKFLRDISIGPIKGTIIGLVIAKQSIRSYPDKKNPGEFRYQLSFTIRDTVADFANVTCWGKNAFIMQLSSLFKTSDIVEIKNPMAQAKQSPEIEERYKPWTPSQYQLVVSENHSNVQLYSGWDFGEFSSFAYIPVRESNDYYTLGDVIANGEILVSSYVNLLAVVKQVSETRSIVSKTGKQLKRKEIRLFDDTCHTFPLVTWEEDFIDLAACWKPRDIVLFITDARVSFDEYRKIMMATYTSKTIVTVNPDTPEARHLYQYAQSADVPPDGPDNVLLTESSVPDPSTVQDFYSVQDIFEKLDGGHDASESVFFGYTCATVIGFDIDHETKDIIRRRCSACRRRYDLSLQSCSNPTCLSANSDPRGSDGKFFEEFDVRLSIGDPSGSMENVLIQPEIVAKLLACEVEEFQTLPLDKRTALKWHHLLERKTIFFKCFRSKPDIKARVVAFEIRDA